MSKSVYTAKNSYPSSQTNNTFMSGISYADQKKIVRDNELRGSWIVNERLKIIKQQQKTLNTIIK